MFILISYGKSWGILDLFLTIFDCQGLVCDLWKRLPLRHKPQRFLKDSSKIIQRFPKDSSKVPQIFLIDSSKFSQRFLKKQMMFTFDYFLGGWGNKSNLHRFIRRRPFHRQIANSAKCHGKHSNGVNKTDQGLHTNQEKRPEKAWKISRGRRS